MVLYAIILGGIFRGKRTGRVKGEEVPKKEK